uniref:Secreted protein n=1 Tax=Setaria italica TaxID=4555 RepID=K3ZY50_SETIT
MMVHTVLWIHMLMNTVVPQMPSSSRCGDPVKGRDLRVELHNCSTASARMKLPRTRAMTSSMYALAMSSADEMPNAGNRNSGAMEATASGTASVIHQRNTQASTPSMLRAAGCPPSSPERR